MSAARPRERGAALLLALLMVAALAAVSVAMLETLRRSLRLDANAGSLAQAQWYAIGAEGFAAGLAADLRNYGVGRTAFAAGDQTFSFPLDAGLMEIRLADGGACINLNAAVRGFGDIHERDEVGAAQLGALFVALGVPQRQSAELVDALVDWMDTDDGRRGVHADDFAYNRRSPAYLTGAEPLAEVSELRAVQGYTPEIYKRIRPFVCALPTLGGSRVNVNSLTPDDAPVLVALTGGRLPLPAAAKLIATRPDQGWSSVGEFWSTPELAALGLAPEAMQGVGLDVDAIAMEATVTHLDAEVTASALLLYRGGSYVTAARRWSAEG
jgi:general secretion pathway protein K